MTDQNSETPSQPSLFNQEAESAKIEIERRCKAAGMTFEDRIDSEGLPVARVGMKAGRDIRWLRIPPDEARKLLNINFENYVFLSDFEAICRYGNSDGIIEASFRIASPTFVPASYMLRRLFDLDINERVETKNLKIGLPGVNAQTLSIEIGNQSSDFAAIIDAQEGYPRSMGQPRRRITLKIMGCTLSKHDEAVALLKKVAGSVFFQIDMLSGLFLTLERTRRRLNNQKRARKQINLVENLQFPKTEFDEAPLSLYGYARSAVGMPLLQFLAFYQVLEFYFPIYAKAEAQRKLKHILKDPTFRGDRDADIGRLLSEIQINGRGDFGDERTQLRATIMECISAEDMRRFLEEEPERKDFFSSKGKTMGFHKLPISNISLDLRGDVSERIYDIRCKIVHTKNEVRTSGVDQLLPFSKEAEQLIYDIELIQHIAQLALIAGSTPLQIDR